MERELPAFILVLLSLAIGFIAIGVAITNYGLVKEQVDSLEAKLTELVDKIESLESKINELSNNIQITKTEINNLKEEINNVKSEIDKTYEEIMGIIWDIEANLTEVNRRLEAIEETSQYIRDWITKAKINPREIEYGLFRCKEGPDTVDLACLSFYLYEKKGITYEEDIIAYNKTDLLLSPQDFLKYKKGDCEDYSFLYYSIVEYLREQGYRYIKVPIYEKFSRYVIWREGSTEYYFEDTGYELIDIQRYYPIVPCFVDLTPPNYTLFELPFTTISAHCVLAFCPQKVEYYLQWTPEELVTIFYEDCILIEPQNYGFYYIRLTTVPELEVVEVLFGEATYYYQEFTTDYKSIEKYSDVYSFIGQGKICEYNAYHEKWICLPFQE